MQSEAFAEYMAYLGWDTLVVAKGNSKTYIYLKKVPLFGTLIKIPKILFPIPFQEIDEISKRHKTLLVRLEPNVVLPHSQKDQTFTYDHLFHNGFTRTWLACELQTVRVDLRQSTQSLFRSLPRENTRRNIRIAQKNKLTAEESSDISLLHNLHAQTAKQRHIYCPHIAELTALWQAFSKGNGAKIVIVRDKDGRPLAGVFLLLYKKVAYYRYVGASPEAPQCRAPTLAVWESLLLAKKYGCTRFDFLGINDSRHEDRKWQGFTQFKLGFSNDTLRYLLPAAKYQPPFGGVVQLFDRLF